MADPTVPDGLSADEARNRLAQFGPNTVPNEVPGGWRSAATKLWAPVPWMLEAAIVLQLAIGEYVQAGVIAVLLLFNGVIGFLQESRAQATLDALKSRLALIASVRRDRIWQTVPASELVPGDVVKLSLGGVVAADMRLIAGSVLLDHSTLTGESLPTEGGPGFETYAGALVRRGEAVAEVTATGTHTRFGRTAELVRTAHVVSSQQRAVLHVVRNLAIFNAAMVLIQVAYATVLQLPTTEIVPLTLTAVLAAIPVALPATFTLASALGAHTLARRGVLPTRLSAIDEAATMDVLCADKTGTLTQNALAVTTVRAMPGFDAAHVLALAALASSEGSQDPVDSAIRAASALHTASDMPRLVKFVPFDPATKMSEATATDTAGRTLRIVKGAYTAIAALAQAAPAATAAAALQDSGYRVLAIAAGPPGALQLAGLIALSDPPRADSAALVADLLRMGVRTVMVTGDAPATATVVARAVGLDGGAVCPAEKLPATIRARDFAVFAGVFPEDKFRIVKAFQARGHTVGMCGDGANDAPALRQAQMGIAVSTATDVAKSAAGIVLTEPGLGGILAAVTEGRVTFQRILTYALRSFTLKIAQMLFLTAGLFVTGHAILTPMLMVILMIAGDLLAMSATTDNVRPSPQPNVWRIGNLTLACIVLGTGNLIFCTGVLSVGAFRLGLPLATLQTLAAVTLVFSGQAAFYAARERRRLWSSWPSRWVVLSSIADVTIISVLAMRGWLMGPLPVSLIAVVLVASVVFAFVLDAVKVVAFARLQIA
jgi:H+-transporting ATPase